MTSAPSSTRAGCSGMVRRQALRSGAWIDAVERIAGRSLVGETYRASSRTTASYRCGLFAVPSVNVSFGARVSAMKARSCSSLDARNHEQRPFGEIAQGGNRHVGPRRNTSRSRSGFWPSTCSKILRWYSLHPWHAAGRGIARVEEARPSGSSRPMRRACEDDVAEVLALCTSRTYKVLSSLPPG